MFWYVLFVKTGYEQKVKVEISRRWELGNSTPFVPMYEARFKRGGRIYSEVRLLCPGYVFIESEMSGVKFYKATRPLISQSENALNLLRYGNGVTNDNFEMKLDEHETFMHLYNEEYCIEMSKGVLEGDKVYITDGPLKGLEGCIKKVRGSKLEAVIEMRIMGQLADVKVGLEIVKKL